MFSSAKNQIAVEVVDTGIGISDADLLKLFKPFSKLEAGS